ncbi:hypothetical protein COMA2_110024 [Candidatus Nitrospira nitrificans]|uniref:Uncharacterized protein n=1 Tax=Candidatus Nitrospira nitrificans TaxID=1742973 RepID=A0A0S4L613_9BACT|nr:hypothetical protein COMA2_110024 [Candidatus Nitrospira nitrificans]
MAIKTLMACGLPYETELTWRGVSRLAESAKRAHPGWTSEWYDIGKSSLLLAYPLSPLSC